MGDGAVLQDAILYFADTEHCKAFITGLRWPDGGVKCPGCGATRVTWLARRRIWKCYAGHARPTFSLKTGTIFEGSAIPLEKWLPVVWVVLRQGRGISSGEIHRVVGVSQKSAWFMMHRIRVAMNGRSFGRRLGRVERMAGFELDGFGAGVEFAEFVVGMRRLLAVPKSELDELVRMAKVESPRQGDPMAPGRKKSSYS